MCLSELYWKWKLFVEIVLHQHWLGLFTQLTVLFCSVRDGATLVYDFQWQLMFLDQYVWCPNHISSTSIFFSQTFVPRDLFFNFVASACVWWIRHFIFFVFVFVVLIISQSFAVSVKLETHLTRFSNFVHCIIEIMFFFRFNGKRELTNYSFFLNLLLLLSTSLVHAFVLLCFAQT